jgi:hypothetical protein
LSLFAHPFFLPPVVMLPRQHGMHNGCMVSAGEVLYKSGFCLICGVVAMDSKNEDFSSWPVFGRLCDMTLIEKIEKRFGAYAIPHLTLYLLLLQLFGIILIWGEFATEQDLVLRARYVMEGQWTRLISFMMIPRTTSPLWIIFSLLILYLMGRRLEERWGAFRYNLFIGCGYLLTVVAAFVVPDAQVTNFYFLGAIFLAFATLYPNIEFLIFFVLPVKVKWLGWITAAIYAMTIMGPSAGDRASALAAFATYFIFFGRSFLRGFTARKRKDAYVAQQRRQEVEPRHRCKVCGVSERDDPSMVFRYCSTCKECFCSEHIGNHEH